MNKVTITIDLLKIDKSRIQERAYANKDGVQVTEKNYKLDIVPSREPRTIKEGDTWKLVKTHFVAESPTQEERINKTKTKIVGDGITMMDKEAAELDRVPEEDEIIAGEIPF